jgi:hypothetical protein
MVVGEGIGGSAGADQKTGWAGVRPSDRRRCPSGSALTPIGRWALQRPGRCPGCSHRWRPGGAPGSSAKEPAGRRWERCQAPSRGEERARHRARVIAGRRVFGASPVFVSGLARAWQAPARFVRRVPGTPEVASEARDSGGVPGPGQRPRLRFRSSDTDPGTGMESGAD